VLTKSPRQNSGCSNKPKRPGNKIVGKIKGFKEKKKTERVPMQQEGNERKNERKKERKKKRSVTVMTETTSYDGADDGKPKA